VTDAFEEALVALAGTAEKRNIDKARKRARKPARLVVSLFKSLLPSSGFNRETCPQL
jgi:hypothetical protein